MYLLRKYKRLLQAENIHPPLIGTDEMDPNKSSEKNKRILGSGTQVPFTIQSLDDKWHFFQGASLVT